MKFGRYEIDLTADVDNLFGHFNPLVFFDQGLGDLGKAIAGKNKFTDKIHQIIKPVNVYPDCRIIHALLYDFGSVSDSCGLLLYGCYDTINLQYGGLPLHESPDFFQSTIQIDWLQIVIFNSL